MWNYIMFHELNFAEFVKRIRYHIISIATLDRNM